MPKHNPSTTDTPDNAGRTYICSDCGQKIHTPARMIENERAEYCETCYRDRFFYHTPHGGHHLERNRC